MKYDTNELSDQLIKLLKLELTTENRLAIIQCVALLKEKKVDINDIIETNMKMPLFHWLVYTAQYEKIELFIEQGFDINKQNQKNQIDKTVFHLLFRMPWFLSQDTNLQMIKFLIETAQKHGKKIDFLITNYESKTPINFLYDGHYPPEKESIRQQIEELLVKEIPNGYELLINALLDTYTSDKIDIIGQIDIIMQYKDSKKTESSCKTPLHVICHKKYDPPLTQIAEHLIEVGFDIEAVDDKGKTPICHAIECYNFEMINFFLQKGAVVTGELLTATLLAEARRYRKPNESEDLNCHKKYEIPAKKPYPKQLFPIVNLVQEHCKILFKNIDTQDDDKNTILHHVVYYEQIPLIQMILQDGADITIKNKYGFSASKYVNMTHGRIELVIHKMATDPKIKKRIQIYSYSIKNNINEIIKIVNEMNNIVHGYLSLDTDKAFENNSLARYTRALLDDKETKNDINYLYSNLNNKNFPFEPEHKFYKIIAKHLQMFQIYKQCQCAKKVNRQEEKIITQQEREQRIAKKRIERQKKIEEEKIERQQRKIEEERIWQQKIEKKRIERQKKIEEERICQRELDELIGSLSSKAEMLQQLKEPYSIIEPEYSTIPVEIPEHFLRSLSRLNLMQNKTP